MTADLSQVVVGGDLLEAMTVAMYADPLVIYRELLQNSSDGIEQAIRKDLLQSDLGRVDITFDEPSRTVRVVDNGSGLSNATFTDQMLSVGASTKRGDAYRGFRGIGRLAGIGHCRALIFRSRSVGDEFVYEARWDGAAVKALLASANPGSLQAIVQQAVSISKATATDQPEQFFEVTLVGLRRLNDDRLFSDSRVREYLSQVAPVPFQPDFSQREAITGELRRRANLLEIALFVNGVQVFKPYSDRVPIRKGRESSVATVDFIEVPSSNEGLAAFGWIAHTDYIGAIQSSFSGRGLRVRLGNLQLGDDAVLSRIFPEERFNAWSLGEFHIFDPSLRPNARRDAFEPSMASDDLVNRLAPYAQSIARRCRDESRRRHKAAQVDRIVDEALAYEIAFRHKRAAVTPYIKGLVAEALDLIAQRLSAALKSDDPGIGAKLIQVREVAGRLRSDRRAEERIRARTQGQLDVLALLHTSGKADLIARIVSELGTLH